VEPIFVPLKVAAATLPSEKPEGMSD
jgi:hypothetical protein